MFQFILITKFIGSILTLLAGIGLIILIRKKTLGKAEQKNPAGMWARAVCFGTDLAVVNILTSLFAFHGNLQAAGYISAIIFFSYFFFSWLFFSTTLAQMFARVKIVSKDGRALKVWQALARYGMTLFLFIGWVWILFDKKEKKALHDVVSQTKVIYTNEKFGLNLESGLINYLRLGALAGAVILIISLMIFGGGEKLSKYSENSQVKFFDLNQDTVPEGLTMDLDMDGIIEVFKYDLNNDHVVDFTTYDANKDGVAESIDLNNDGRIDGLDFDNDNKLDIKLFRGQFFIWLWRVWFGTLCLGLVGLFVFTVLKDRRVL